ncbi:MAG: hypothetical protein ACTHJ5_06865 [Ilyomonas sp.]
MLTKNINIKLLIAIFLVFLTQATIASFTGNFDDNKDKYSLKSLNRLSKNYSLSSLRGSFQYKGSLNMNQQYFNNNNTVEVNSMIRFEKGNTTYVYPYRYKVKVPRFKTPTPQP